MNRALLLSAVLLCPLVVHAAAPNPAVCRIMVAEAGGHAYGSGTLIDARDRYGLVVTNWHVVRDATGPVSVIFPSGFQSQARVVKLDETWDLAALVVWRPPAEPAPLASQPPQPGERLTICGYGQGDYREATGRCTDYYAPEMGKPMELVELSVQARQGDSGGPILNQRGELAGVLFGAGQGVTLGSYGGRVRGFLATLAPDIGLPQPEHLIAAKPATVTSIAAPSADKPSAEKVVDPFQAAERTAPEPEAIAASPRVEPPASATLPQRRDPQHDWRSVPYDSWKVAVKEPTQSVAPAWPIAPQQPARPTAPANLATQTPQLTAAALDWDSERSTLVAIAGVSAVAVLIGRALG